MLMLSDEWWQRYQTMASADGAAAEKKLGLGNELKNIT